MAVIVIDPDHGGTRMMGGSSPNDATGPAGTKEKTVTLAVGLAARTALSARGYTVFMTHQRCQSRAGGSRACCARSSRGVRLHPPQRFRQAHGAGHRDMAAYAPFRTLEAPCGPCAGKRPCSHQMARSRGQGKEARGAFAQFS